jgi:hypothetical protein
MYNRGLILGMAIFAFVCGLYAAIAIDGLYAAIWFVFSLGLFLLWRVVLKPKK